MLLATKFFGIVLAGTLVTAQETSPAAKRKTSSGTFESLAGFAPLVAQQLKTKLKGEPLPRGTGSPLEPGIFTLVAADGISIYDGFYPLLRGGRAMDTQRAASCEGTCPMSMFDVFTRAYARLVDESERIGSQMPSRILVGAAASVPAVTFLDVFYTAAETWPRSPVPNLYLLFEGGDGAPLAKPISLVPPAGLVVLKAAQPLALRIVAHADGTFDVSGGDPAFGAGVTLSSKADLMQGLAIVKKRYPNKNAFILEPDDQLTMSQLVETMESIQTIFSLPILARHEQQVTVQ